MEPQQLASLLRRPSGEYATQVGSQMNKSNERVNQKAISLLSLSKGDRVLEIGQGNGAFVHDIVSSAEDILYTGVDWSTEMTAEAQRINDKLIEQGRASFLQGQSDVLPFPAARFNKVLCVNTLYFWDNPLAHFVEIHRVMRDDGIFCLSFGAREFMQTLGFASHGFNLYDSTEVEALLKTTHFTRIKLSSHCETGPSNTGETVNKKYWLFECRK